MKERSTLPGRMVELKSGILMEPLRTLIHLHIQGKRSDLSGKAAAAITPDGNKGRFW